MHIPVAGPPYLVLHRPLGIVGHVNELWFLLSGPVVHEVDERLLPPAGVNGVGGGTVQDQSEDQGGGV